MQEMFDYFLNNYCNVKINTPFGNIVLKLDDPSTEEAAQLQEGTTIIPRRLREDEPLEPNSNLLAEEPDDFCYYCHAKGLMFYNLPVKTPETITQMTPVGPVPAQTGRVKKGTYTMFFPYESVYIFSINENIDDLKWEQDKKTGLFLPPPGTKLKDDEQGKGPRLTFN